VAQTPQPEAESNLLPIGFHLGQDDALHMEAVRAAGGSFAVVVFNWANIEPEPNYVYWEVPDAALRTAEFYGIDLIVRLDQPPTWALETGNATHPPGLGQTPWQLEAYTNFARRVAERYGDRLAGVIIWNEPNLNLEWNNQPPDALAYTEMLKVTYPAVKAVAPDLPVLLGGLASTEGEGDWAINDLDYLQALYDAGAGGYFDVLTAHPYGFGRPPDDPPEKFRPNFRRLELYREIMDANGDGDKPIWVTEMGWLTWTNDPDHNWQVVTPEVQADYTLQAIAYAQNFYPWLERLGIWELNSAGDDYGYNIWQGPENASPAYNALVQRYQTTRARPQQSDATLTSTGAPAPQSKIVILAPDATIRLGDRSTLHPHWVHLHRAGRNFSPTWQGEFFLTAGQATQDYDLLVETMQIDQATNRLFINGIELAHLRTRPRPNPTSTWVTQRFSLPPNLLEPGINTLSLAIGPRNAARQYIAGRWENMQFRNIRLVSPYNPPRAILSDWQAQPAPSGWSETNRLRPGLANELWLTGIRPGELWQGVIAPSRSVTGEATGHEPVTGNTLPSGRLTLENQSGNRPDLVFNDIWPTVQGELVATHIGLFWRSSGQPDWQPVAGTPDSHAYVVVQANDHFYAGFEAEGLWRARLPSGPWQRTPLTATNVVDLVTIPYKLPGRLAPVDRLYATTEAKIFTNNGLDDNWHPLLVPALSAEEMDEAGESPGDKFKPRLYVAADGRLVVRHQDRLWLQSVADDQPPGISSELDLSNFQNSSPSSNSLPALNSKLETQSWQLFGPEKLYGKLFSVLNCCGTGTVVGTNDAGLWQLTTAGEWQRLDTNSFFDTTDATELLQLNDSLYAAGDLGLFQSFDGRVWHKVEGLPAIVSDLLVDPAKPSRWLAGTPAGIYRSEDAGQTWTGVTPPWTVWDMAFDRQGRLFVGRSKGLARIDDLNTMPLAWQTTAGLEKVYFLSVNPHPAEPEVVWTGTWGNNIGVSNDGGHSIAPLHNGLETLSGLDLIWHPTPGQVTLATFEGLYRTDDGGQNWLKLPGPLMQQTVYALLQTTDGAIWAGTADGLWVSRDYGVNWELVNGLPQSTILRLGKVTVLPPAPITLPFIGAVSKPQIYPAREWLWAGTENAGLWISQDNGLTWHFAGMPERTIYNIFFDPLRPRRLIAATDQGIFKATVLEKIILALTQP
jgi:photosystem II stability/assembly factor-like uncharacterized protein